jgi:hypothetical protein
MERRPEVILFGPTPELKIVKQLEPTPSLRITPMSSGLIRVAKRTLSGEILQTIITSDLVSLIKSMIAVQGNYGDLVHTLDAIERCGACSTALALHPLPRTGRLYGTATEVESSEAISTEAISTEADSTETDSSQRASSETYEPQSQDYPQEVSSSPASTRNESVVKESESSSSASRSYATSKTPWYRRMPFTNTSD